MTRLKIVVLAAGFSSRLGQPKALARVHGVSLLRRTLMLAACLRAAGIVAVVPPASACYRREAGHLAVTWAPNAQRALGLSSSVRCGLRYSRYASAALLLPVDLAQLKLAELKCLVSRWQAAPHRVFATRLPGSIAGYAGTPLILPVRLFPCAATVYGDVGLRGLVAGLPEWQRTLVDLPSAHSDIDTVADLARARQRWSRPANITRGEAAQRAETREMHGRPQRSWRG
jgi:molybdenum cofactor cytidylyltransferase